MSLKLLVFLTILGHTAFHGSRVTVSLQALSLGASPFTVGILIALYAALPMLLAVHAGRLVDRIGVRRPLLFSTLALTSAVLIPAVFSGITPLYFAAVAIGTSFLVFSVAIQHAVGMHSSPEERARDYSYLSIGFSISGFLGPTLAGFAIDLAGHARTFLFLSLVALVPFLILLTRRDTIKAHHAAEEHEGPRRLLDLLRDRDLRRLFVVTGVLAMAWDLFAFVMPIYGTSIGLSASTIGMVLGSFALATLTVRLLLPWLTRHLREWQMITVTMLIGCVAYALMPLMRTVPLLAAMAFVLGLGLGATQSSMMSLLHSTAPRGRAGEALGVRAAVINGSSTFLPLAFGGVGAALGLAPVFWSMAACLGVTGWFANRRRRALER
jgi:predicted MFS family arabinose efflux permease